ncbi:hypothetical protein D3C75_1012910 [compost metagenome]
MLGSIYLLLEVSPHQIQPGFFVIDHHRVVVDLKRFDLLDWDGAQDPTDDLGECV